MITPRFKRNLKSWIEKNFPNAESHARKQGLEYDFICPFCHGGEHNDLSFNLNADKGVGRCWRAKCKYQSSATKIVADFSGISYDDAKEFLTGSGDYDLPTLRNDLDILKILLKNKYEPDDLLPEILEEEVPNSMPLDDSPFKDKVVAWLSGIRGYDAEKFLSHHKIFVPPHYIERNKGRIGFTVETGDSYAYILYAVELNEKKPQKTINPYGEILSRLIYNYNHVTNKNTVFITEGVFDCARLHSWGFAATAIFGTRLQPEQAYLFSKLSAKEIVICLDNGTEDMALDMIRQLKDYVDADVQLSRMVLTKEGSDPDSITEEEFLLAYGRRRKRIERDVSGLVSMLKNNSRMARYGLQDV